MQLFVDNIINLDFSYLDPERGLVGETWLASIVLEGQLDKQSMICDFGKVKARTKAWLTEHIDHQLLIPSQSKHLSLVDEPMLNERPLEQASSDQKSDPSNQHDNQGDNQGQALTLMWQTKDDKHIFHQSPQSAITLVEAELIDSNTLAHWCEHALSRLFGSNITLSLQFAPEKIDGPYYHYSHGLKKHEGQCQRIAHGHRSAIMIWRDGVLSLQDMRHWANQWKDIYIATREDSAERPHAGLDNDHNLHFAYTSIEGQFKISLPKERVWIMDDDSTVECIAQHIASELANNHPGHHFRVRAYEGFNKGAIAESNGVSQPK